jgi:multiple sugar transport system substrate-binding protein
MSAHQRVSRRTFVQGGFGAAAGLSLAARSGRSFAARAQDNKEVSFMNWDTVAGTPIETAINAFQEASGYTVKIQPTPTTDYETKMRTLLASGSPPDIMRINDDFVRGYSLDNQLLDLNPYIESSGLNPADYNEHPYKFPIQPDGQHTAWTIGTQPSVIFYNVDLFNEVGLTLPPGTWTGENWTWDTFLEAAMALSIADERWGALLSKDTSAETIYTVNNGEPTGIYSEDGTQFTLANPAAIEGMQWVADLSCVHNAQPPFGNLTQDNATNQYFVSGRVAMLSSTLGFASYATQNATFTWDIAPPPAGKADQKTIATLIDFVIPKDAKNPDGAWELLNFLGGPDAGKIFADAGVYVPVHKEASALIKPVEGKSPAHLDLVVEATSHATNENFSKNIQRARQIYRPELDLLWTCQKSAEEVLTGVKEQVEKALAGEI